MNDYIRPTKSPRWVCARLVLVVLIAGLATACSNDSPSAMPNQVPSSPDPADDPTTGPDTPNPDSPDPATDGAFRIEVRPSSVDIIEGGATVAIPLNILRSDSSAQPIQISIEIDGSDQGGNAEVSQQLNVSVNDATIAATESSTTLRIQLPIGAKPILPNTQKVTITGTDSTGGASQAELSVQITPTDKPDVYLLIGQSNMVGISEEGAKANQPGQPDASSTRVMQLNVTGNDKTFSTAADFTDPQKLYNNNQPLTLAVDPLHQGLESSGDKTGTRIGMGISFWCLQHGLTPDFANVAPIL